MVVRTDPETGRVHYTHQQVLEILSGLLMALLTSMVSTSVISTALPTILGELGGQDQLSWVASASLLTMTAATPLWGKLSDLFGRKAVFQTALIIFTVGSVTAGFSQNILQLIIARAVQGLGVGGLSALTQVILGDVVEPRERGRYAGYVGGVFGVSTVAGPLLGGFIVDTGWLGWRWTFFISVPLAVVSFVLIQKVLRLPRVRKEVAIDWLGAFAITGSAAAVMLLLTLGGKEFAWNSAWTYLLGALTALLLALAVHAERVATDAILPARLFRNRTFVLTSAASLFLGVALFGVMIFLPQYLQIVRGMSPTASGLMTLPMVLGLFLAGVVTGRVTTRTGRWRVFPTVGLLLVTAGMVQLSRLHLDSGLWLIGVETGVLGVGIGMTLQTLILAAQNDATRQDMAVVTSGVSFFRSLGGAVGVAGFGAILTNRLHSEIAQGLRALHVRPPADGGLSRLGSPAEIHDLPEPFRHVLLEAFTTALQAVFLVGVPIALLGFFAVIALREHPLRSARD